MNNQVADQAYPKGTTKLIAFMMLSGAQKYLFTLLPRCHNLYEHPELNAAIADIQDRERQLGRELRQAELVGRINKLAAI